MKAFYHVNCNMILNGKKMLILILERLYLIEDNIDRNSSDKWSSFLNHVEDWSQPLMWLVVILCNINIYRILRILYACCQYHYTVYICRICFLAFTSRIQSYFNPLNVANLLSVIFCVSQFPCYIVESFTSTWS